MAVEVVKSNISKKWAILYPIIFILIGVGVILLGYFMINKSSGWIKTTGEIIDIVNDYGAEGKTYSKAYVNYFADGVLQEHVLLDAFENYFKIGVEVNIKYNPSNLSQITYDNQSYFSVCYIVGGVICALGVLIGAFVWTKILKDKKSI